MANYYHIDIESNNLTADVAAEILVYVGNHHIISDFQYCHGEYINGKVGGKLYMYIRGISDFSNILEKYKITDEEVILEDEFERAYKYMNDKPIIFLNELLELSNIENEYAFGNIQKNETNWELVLIHSPKLGYTEIHYDDYKMCRVKSFSYGEAGLLIDLEPLPDFISNDTNVLNYKWED